MKRTALLFLFVFLGWNLFSQVSPEMPARQYSGMAIIPEPVYSEISPTEYFPLTSVQIECPDNNAGKWAEKHLKQWYGKLAPKVVAGSSIQSEPMGDEEYRLVSDDECVKVTASTLQGVRYALYTLRQMAIPARRTAKVEGWIVPEAMICDKPQMDFRGIHICWFHENKAWEIERLIRLAAYYKLNYAVIEPWGTFRSNVAPWLGWPDGNMTKKEVKRLVALADDLGIALIPQLNVFGHATMGRVGAGKHATIDLSPEYQTYFEPLAGWNWCLSNPHTIQLQKDLIKERYEDFGRPPYFHIGCDEASTPSCPDCISKTYSTLFLEHVNDINEYVKGLGARTMMWHDMLLDGKDSRWKGLHAKGTAETASGVDHISRDVIICDWYYRKALEEYPSHEYFKGLGFDVLACPWNNNEGTVSQCRSAHKTGIKGILGTLWNHYYGRWMVDIYFNVANLAWNGNASLKVHDNPYCNQYAVHTHLRQVGWDMGVKDSRRTGTFYDEVPREPYYPAIVK